MTISRAVRLQECSLEELPRYCFHCNSSDKSIPPFPNLFTLYFENQLKWSVHVYVPQCKFAMINIIVIDVTNNPNALTAFVISNINTCLTFPGSLKEFWMN